MHTRPVSSPPSGFDFSMDPSQWQHQQQPQHHNGLQLEQEYDQDPALISILHNDLTQHFDGRQAPMQQQQQQQQATFYPQSFARANQPHGFTFAGQPSQGMSVQYNDGFTFRQSPTTATQQSPQHHSFTGAGSVYSSSVTSSTSQSTLNDGVFRGGGRPFHIQAPAIQQGAAIGVSQGSHSSAGLAIQTSMDQYQHHQQPKSTQGSDMTQHLYPPIMTPSFSSSSSDLGTEQQVAMGSAPYLAPDSRRDASQHSMKRARVPDDGYADDEGGDQVGNDTWKEPAKSADEAKLKLTRACQRCRGLKVACKFERSTETCNRCLKARHECIIPGRKKRKPPPKREDLLKQIRDQHTQIENLMDQLEQLNRKVGRPSRPASPTHSAATTDLLSTASFATGDPTSSDAGSPMPDAEHITKPDVLDWIAKARESINAFGGYISMGGPSVTKEELGEDEYHWSDSADTSGDDFTFAVEDYDASGGETKGVIGLSDMSREASEDESPNVTRRAQFLDGSASGASRKKSGGSSGKTKLATLPSESAPLGLMAKLHMRTKPNKKWPSGSASDASAEDVEDVGFGNSNYFRASPAPERPVVYETQDTPHIFRTGLISGAEAEQLFDIYFNYMNLSLSLLDPKLYTAQNTVLRSPFLFTVICAIASRHYAVRTDLYSQAMKYARLAAGTALIGGQKSVEVVQAFLLLSLYPVPSRKWEDDRSWIFLGVSIRIAMDLNLHHPNAPKPENELHARELLNRTRTWLNCFNVDRSMSSQYGKAPMIDNRDYVACHCDDWWQSSPFNMDSFDIQTCCYTAELRVIADFGQRIRSDPNNPNGMSKNVEVIVRLATETDDYLVRLWDFWISRIKATNKTDLQNQFRIGLLKLAYSYARLTALAVAFQQSFGKTAGEAPFLRRCIAAATDVVSAVVDGLAIPEQKIFLRHGPEAQSVFVTFASAFLVKLLQPKFSVYLSRDQRIDIRKQVQRVIDVLGSPEIAIDERHAPKLYSKFLAGLLATPFASVDPPPRIRSTSSTTTSELPSPAQDVNAMQDVHIFELSEATRESLSPSPLLSSPPAFSPKPDPPSSFSIDMFTNTQGTTDTVSSGGVQDDLSNLAYMSPPLPFDSELLQTMQTHELWPSDMILPGFGWMGNVMESDINVRYDMTSP